MVAQGQDSQVEGRLLDRQHLGSRRREDDVGVGVIGKHLLAPADVVRGHHEQDLVRRVPKLLPEVVHRLPNVSARYEFTFNPLLKPLLVILRKNAKGHACGLDFVSAFLIF